MKVFFPSSCIPVSVKYKLHAETEDVAHIPVHVHTVLLLTSDLTNCQTHRKGTQQTPQLVHSQILLLLSPCTPLALQPITLLYEKMSGLQKHLKYGRCFIVLLLCNCSVIIQFLFPCHRFWGSVWWWWHPVTETNVSSEQWWMTFTPLHVFFSSTFFFVESKPTIYRLMTYNFLS